MPPAIVIRPDAQHHGTGGFDSTVRSAFPCRRAPMADLSTNIRRASAGLFPALLSVGLFACGAQPRAEATEASAVDTALPAAARAFLGTLDARQRDAAFVGPGKGRWLTAVRACDSFSWQESLSNQEQENRPGAGGVPEIRKLLSPEATHLQI